MTQKSRVVVFDLDDTLYKEWDYLQSAYREIAAKIESHYGLEGIFDRMHKWWQEGENVFQRLIDMYTLDITVNDLLAIYHSHVPAIRLDEETKCLLDRLHQHAILGLITDGRSLTQRHKIEALGLSAYMDASDILISEETGFEKPSEEPFRHFMARYPSCTYYYIGDNPAKDFVAPNHLGWTSICLLNDGRNIHSQSGMRNEESGMRNEERGMRKEERGMWKEERGMWKVEGISEIENIII